MSSEKIKKHFSKIIILTLLLGGIISIAKLSPAYAALTVGVPKPTPSGLASGLVGHWTFDGKDCGLTYCVDKSGSGNTSTLTGATRTTGKIGQGLNFNGTSDTATVTQNASINTVSVTASAWVKTTDTGAFRGVIDKGWGGTCPSCGGYILDINSNDVRFNIKNTSGTFFTANGGAVADGKWHHLVGTFDSSAGEVKLYIDAVLKETVSSASMGEVTDNLSIGGDGVSTSYLNGSIDDARIYNRVLSANEVYQLYRLGQ